MIKQLYYQNVKSNSFIQKYIANIALIFRYLIPMTILSQSVVITVL